MLARAHLGSALLVLGLPGEALAELRSAVEIADALVNPVGRWQSRVALAAALDATGDHGAAAATTVQAGRILTEFAVTLAPERAATLLAAPRAREILDATP